MSPPVIIGLAIAALILLALFAIFVVEPWLATTGKSYEDRYK